MLRHTTGTLAAVLALAAACSSNTVTEPAARAPVAPITVTHLDTARGRILSPDSLAPDAGIVMLTDAGDTLRLVGAVADLIANTYGVELWVQGQFNDDGSMQVLNYALRDDNDNPMCGDPIVRIIPADGPCNGFLAGMKPNAQATWNRGR